MSYDVSVSGPVDTGGPKPLYVTVLDENYTSNCAPMWRAAGADLAEMNGKPAAECGPVVAAAVAAMRADPAKYRAMNPPNGWGDYDSCLRFLEAIAGACLANPSLTVEVSH